MNIEKYKRPLLAKWCLDHYGPWSATGFKSARQWSIKSGLGPNAVNNIMHSGKVTNEEIKSLCKSANICVDEPLSKFGVTERVKTQIPNGRH